MPLPLPLSPFQWQIRCTPKTNLSPFILGAAEQEKKTKTTENEESRMKELEPTEKGGFDLASAADINSFVDS